MTAEQQNVALIQTLLHFIGANNYKPSASTVLAFYREVSGQSISGWDVSQNKGTSGAPVSGVGNGWDVKSNNKGTTSAPVSGVAPGWDVKSSSAGSVKHNVSAKPPRH